MDDTYPQWNLKEFYDSYKSEKIDIDIEKIRSSTIKFNKKYKNTLKNLSNKKIIQSIKEFEIIEERIGKLKSYIYLIYCTNQLDTEIVAFYQKVNEQLTNIDSNLLFFCLELNSLSEKKINMLEGNRFFVWLKNLRKFKNYQKKEEHLGHILL